MDSNGLRASEASDVYKRTGGQVLGGPLADPLMYCIYSGAVVVINKTTGVIMMPMGAPKNVLMVYHTAGSPASYGPNAGDEDAPQASQKRAAGAASAATGPHPRATPATPLPPAVNAHATLANRRSHAQAAG